MDSENFVPSLLFEKIKLSPKYLNKNYRTIIKRLLVDKNEGICSKHGYVKQHSIELVQISMGTVETHTLHGYINFHVKFKALVCNPTTGSIIKCKVKNSNNFGILCSSGSIIDGDSKEIIDVIIPKNSLSISSDPSVDINSLINGDFVNVEIMGKKFEINDKRISAVGKIVSISNDNTELSIDVENNEDDNIIIEDDDVYEEDFDIDNLNDDESVDVSNSLKSKKKDKSSDTINVKVYDENEQNDDDDDDDDDDDMTMVMMREPLRMPLYSSLRQWPELRPRARQPTPGHRTQASLVRRSTSTSSSADRKPSGRWTRALTTQPA